jgi:hypothetical protein
VRKQAAVAGGRPGIRTAEWQRELNKRRHVMSWIEAQSAQEWQMEKEMAGGTNEGQPKKPCRSPPAAPQHSRYQAAK